MTVREFINELEYYDEDMELVMKPRNSSYVSLVKGVDIREISRFWGEDKRMLVIMADDQIGSV